MPEHTQSVMDKADDRPGQRRPGRRQKLQLQ